MPCISHLLPSQRLALETLYQVRTSICNPNPSCPDIFISLAQETHASYLWFYRICWIIWVTLGIAYWAIIISFITKALKVTNHKYSIHITGCTQICVSYIVNQSKELRQRWQKTSHAIAHQAKEMRRVMEHQLSQSNVHHHDAFVAVKSKVCLQS